MKFKFKVNTGDLLLKVNPEIAEQMPSDVVIDVETECTLEELKGLYDIQKDMLKESPILLKEFFENSSDTISAIRKFDFAVTNRAEYTEADSKPKETTVS